MKPSRRLDRERHPTVSPVTHSAAATFGDRTIGIRDGRIIRDVRRQIAPEKMIPLHESPRCATAGHA